MKIAILSDTHDNVENTKTAIQNVTNMGAEILFFCGDFCAPGPAKVIAEFKGPIYAVFGNNDGDRLSISQKMKAINSNVTFFLDGEGELELAGKKIAINHYPLYATALAKTGDYDLVCFGHDHQPRIETYGKCLAVNPGCLNIVKSGTFSSFALYDTTAHAATLHALDGSFLTV
jgi:putative phosphoesterase